MFSSYRIENMKWLSRFTSLYPIVGHLPSVICPQIICLIYLQ